jgi:ComF family protein
MQGIFQCPNCEGQRWHLSVIIPGCRYEGLARELIQRFKYGHDQSLMRPLGDLMLPTLQDPRLAGKKFDAIVPVPLHSLREREREFNQSSLLAMRLASHLHLPVIHHLKRTHATVAQAGFDRSHRLKNLEGAFALRHHVEEGASLLLVDDVTTTGTTLNACAAMLMEAGAGEVCAVTVARG